MSLKQLPSHLKNKRIFLRVDWNIPVHGHLGGEDVLKLDRTFATLRDLKKRGAITLIATHWGRPRGVDPKLSTKHLVKLVAKRSGLRVIFLPDLIESSQGLKRLQKRLVEARPGDLFLLENVRFLKGEEKNAPALGRAFASCVDFFINDAFASCHRKHASVVGLAPHVPAYAGPSLRHEVQGLQRVLHPKRPFVAIIGGAKLSTKIDILSALLRKADRVLIGTAMAHPFLVAQGLSIGQSFVEQDAVPVAKKMLKNSRILLPVDVVVQRGSKKVTCAVTEMKDTDAIGDIGPQTLKMWSKEIAQAKTLMWNGPVGIYEDRLFIRSSLRLAEMIAARSRSKNCYGVVGGGDTVPVMLRVRHHQDVDHLSTGGGAMLEFITKGGRLPGLDCLFFLRKTIRALARG